MYLKGVNDFSTRKGERFSQKVMTETNRGRANEDVPENVVMIVSEETPILLNIRACKSLYYSHTSSHTRVDVLGARMGLEKYMYSYYSLVFFAIFTTISCQLFTQEYTTRNQRLQGK